MGSIQRSATTRLTEAQARALADWWGGRYRQIASSKNSEEIWHGVVVSQHDWEDLAMPYKVFSLEEAQALENIRDAVNPGSQDWVG